MPVVAREVEEMDYCGKCAGEVGPYDTVCGKCGAPIEKSVTFTSVAKKPEKNIFFTGFKLVVIFIIVLFLILALIPNDREDVQEVVAFNQVDEVTYFLFPAGVEGSFTNVAEASAIYVSDITFSIHGNAVEGVKTYTLSNCIENFNGTVITPGQTIDFYVKLPEFKDEVYSTGAPGSVYYYVTISHNGQQNDAVKFDATDLYDFG